MAASPPNGRVAAVARRVVHGVRRRARALLSAPHNTLNAAREGLPFDPTLRAFNVTQVDVPPQVVRDARALYERAIEPHLNAPEGSLRVGERTFFARHPGGWQSDICWWSADDAETFQVFQALFDALAPALVEAGCLRRGDHLYSGFLISRSWCEAPFMHHDYPDECGTDAHTLMTPIDDWCGPTGQLRFVDALSFKRKYVYRKGKAIVFGARFIHGTDVCRDLPRAFLCFTFGSSDPAKWPPILEYVRDQGRLIRGPNGTLVPVR